MPDLLKWFRKRQSDAMQRAVQQAAAERARAAMTLALDDAKFQGKTILGDEEPEYRSAIGEDWEDE